MIGDRHVDGNALGGLFHDLFGREMTGETVCCGVCDATGPLGSLVAYREAPGAVVRCLNCGSVLLVAVALPGRVRVSLEALRWVDVTLDEA